MQNKVPKLQNVSSFGSVITPLFLSPNGYTHHPLKVKSHGCPLHTEDVMPKPSHTSLLSETVGNLHGIELWGREKGEQVGVKRKGNYTCRTSRWRGALCWITMAWIRLLYMLHEAASLGTITYKYRQARDPEHSQGKQNFWSRPLVLEMGNRRPREEVSCQKTRGLWQFHIRIPRFLVIGARRE